MGPPLHEFLRPILRTWIKLNPSMDELSHPLLSVGWNYLSVPKLNGMDK